MQGVSDAGSSIKHWAEHAAAACSLKLKAVTM